MKIDFKFEIGQKVEILPIQVTGRVVALYVAQAGPEYKVRFFDNCECNEIFFFPDELKAIQAE